MLPNGNIHHVSTTLSGQLREAGATDWQAAGGTSPHRRMPADQAFKTELMMRQHS
jgi:hypothetical protein